MEYICLVFGFHEDDVSSLWRIYGLSQKHHVAAAQGDTIWLWQSIHDLLREGCEIVLVIIGIPNIPTDCHDEDVGEFGNH